jgi:hypothetical protein
VIIPMNMRVLYRKKADTSSKQALQDGFHVFTKMSLLRTQLYKLHKHLHCPLLDVRTASLRIESKRL